ncbi:hypothetical protein GGI21_006828 [Coemansia aciculifera]|uniref:Uncharacterized protein n=1 Tax=Coemansia aciculifera TaxID=417176 RepID=A0ACC1LXU7_9FUNG|nr:hypothetical protein GGI21_006828 [Coemansia aciculifera]KAJ2889634.1 hypothetical protein IWW38_004593 [Coemansia aciculifera]
MSSFKIASLLFRTLSKPVATALKQQAKSHDLFRSMCINVAQLAHRTEMNWKMNVLGYKKEKIRPLNDAKAIDAGANFLGEAFIFSVALSLLFAEQLRSRNQAQRQRNAVDDRLDDLERGMSESKEDLRRMQEERDLLQTQVDSLTEESASLSTILMQILSKELNRHSIERGHSPTEISQAHVDSFKRESD